MPCVYVLTNPAIPGLVKIGYTTDTAAARAAQISATTGVPEPYVVAWYAETTDGPAADRLETLVHQGLASERHNRAREFFAVTVDHAREVIEQAGHAAGLIRITSTEIAERAATIRAEIAERQERERQERKRQYELQRQENEKQAAIAAQKEYNERQREASKARQENEKIAVWLALLGLVAAITGILPLALVLWGLAYWIHPNK